MKKILVLLMVIILTLPTAVCAKEIASLPLFNVTFNNQTADSTYRQYPLLVYKDITYIPMTYYDCRYMGLTTKWDNDTKTLYIEKGSTTCAYRDYNWEWKNGRIQEVTVCEFNIVVNGKQINNLKEEYPLLTFRDVTYFPLTWRFAVDEFGWEYGFDADKGLSVSSDNIHVKNVDLPHITGGVATDGKYYYYGGEKDGEKVVFRASVSDASSPQIIHKQLESPLTRPASFINSCGDIYITYFAGYSAVTGSQRYFKIEADGNVSESIPDDKYSYGKHGSSEIRVTENGINVRGVHEYFDGPTLFYYEKDGKSYEAEKLPGRIRVGRRRNAASVGATGDECIQVFNGKIYYTATDLDTSGDSDLYCIDTKTGENKKILDSVCGFHVYNGWLNEANADSTMIIYDKDGCLMRYSELNGDIREIENGNWKQGMILDSAVGGYDIYTVQKNINGDRTVVKGFSCYASGNGSLNNTVLLDTKTGTKVKKIDDKICISASGESADDEVRLLVLGNEGQIFMSADVANEIFVNENTLLYKIGENSVARVDLKCEEENEFRVIGYYSGDLFDEPLEKLQTDKLTHIMYAFLIPKSDGSCVPFENPEKVKALVNKAHKDGCRVYVAVGGWSYKDIPLVTIFETVSENDSLRKKLIESIMAVVDEYGFDGVELDWEYPSEASQGNYEKLILELGEKLKNKGKHITAALNGAWSPTEGPEVSNYVSGACLNAFEFINVMSYDANNEQHSPYWFAETSIEYWLNRGVSADKIVLGMPLYARPSWMQYRHLVAENRDFAYSDYANINEAESYYNGLPTLCKKTVLAKEKAGGVMLFDVNEDTNDELSVVTMIDNVITQLEENGALNEEMTELLLKE